MQQERTTLNTLVPAANQEASSRREMIPHEADRRTSSSLHNNARCDSRCSPGNGRCALLRPLLSQTSGRR
ncbi:hypothetical protein DPEC_G00285650 [Dallia pectoralis]|uniref:Uncharacterized protein n=1 Tax=Dallia pectoralis TaxID=75939 RepID=A0ACC2FJV5_DALPE|nr:hypothetical protein DPEC_G00285650 [Dallia pectoralis]